MRRGDREIADFQEIADVLSRCDTIRIGLRGEEYPYVVPVSFGWAVEEGRLAVYFHGAKEGLKHDLIARDNRVCVEADIFKGYAGQGANLTTRYESVIGFGRAEQCDHAQAVRGIRLVMEHVGQPDYDGEQCVMLGVTTLYRILLDSVTGKRREI